ncbi:restriction endonuclease subunit S, partial [Xanthomonas euvesicatoria]|uniref:restriction endonuclease subunit S n=1 Tax=Xanthomonas euvesicatoria TaxID=456327 RepID=UPI001C446ADB
RQLHGSLLNMRRVVSRICGALFRASLDQRDYFDKDIATAGKVDGYYVVSKGDYVYNPRTSAIAPVGPISRNNLGEGLMSPLYTVFAFLKKKTDFYEHYFKSSGWHSYLRSAASTGARHDRMSITAGAFMRMPVPSPSREEQKKIADCLTSLDEVIVAQGRKVEALKVHKRGLMQQLFPRKGETRPRFRFPEFRDAPEWREGALGSLTVKVGSGVTPRGGDSNYKRKGRPFVRSQNVDWGQLLLDDIVFIDESTHESFNGTEIADSDVLLTITGASIGRSAIADYRIVGGNVNQHVCIIRTNQSELNPVLLSHFLISERGKEQIDGFQAGGNRQGLNFAQIRSFKIPLPPTSHEQKRISDCLSSLDTQINAESAQLTALKTHKQGLMQQLFPAQRAG